MATPDDQAALCKSQLQTIPDLQVMLSKCRNAEEVERAVNLSVATNNPILSFNAQASQLNDMMMTGDKLFGTQPASSVLKEVSARNKDLKDKKKHLKNDIRDLTAIVERSDRDFIDEKELVPETLSSQVVHVLDDYTLIILMVSYVFVTLSSLFYYIIVNEFSINSIITGLVFTVVFSIFMVLMAMLLL